MNLENLVRGLIGLGKKKPRVSPLRREDALQVRPVRNPALEWETDEEGLALIKIPRRRDLTGKLLAGVFEVPDSRGLQLDEVGSFVWGLCDGERSVEAMIAAMCERYRLSRREVEVSLTEFLKLLGRRGLIAVAVPREVVERLDPQTIKQLGIVVREDLGQESRGTGEDESPAGPAEEEAQPR